jgi:hypothetical protein
MTCFFGVPMQDEQTSFAMRIGLGCVVAFLFPSTTNLGTENETNSAVGAIIKIDCSNTKVKSKPPRQELPAHGPKASSVQLAAMVS